MSLSKAIKSGKEHRKPYYGAASFDSSCRPGGGCPWCEGNRFHADRRRRAAADEQIKEWENSGPFVVAYLGNGFKRWSFPPHCPSWRRDREEFVGQEGCTLCGGKGRKMIYRPYGQGGPYPENCKTCWPKYLEILEERGRAG